MDVSTGYMFNITKRKGTYGYLGLGDIYTHTRHRVGIIEFTKGDAVVVAGGGGAGK